MKEAKKIKNKEKINRRKELQFKNKNFQSKILKNSKNY